MPVEIRELVITAAVTDTSNAQRQQSQPVDTNELKKEIVKECVKQVLQKLKDKSER